MPSFFDDLVRTDRGPAAYAEPRFQYWNRSARSDIAAARAMIDEWFARYPGSHANELRVRARCDDVSFSSALFELFLHELLLRLGCSLEIHPSVPESSRKPEFRVNDTDGTQWYLEATVASGESKEQATIRMLKNRIRDTLNELLSPDFYINIEIVAARRRQLPLSRLKAFVEKRLSNRTPPPWRFEFEGWLIVFDLMERFAASTRRSGVRPLGIEFIPLHVIETAKAIREAVRAKAKRYGALRAPFVVAVNALCEHVDFDDEIDALFGDDGPRGRMPNGAWRDRSGWRNSRVSAVLCLRKFQVWNLDDVPCRLYHHPTPTNPYTGVLTTIPQVKLEADRLVAIGGRSVAEIFGVAHGWLGPEDDDDNYADAASE